MKSSNHKILFLLCRNPNRTWIKGNPVRKKQSDSTKKKSQNTNQNNHIQKSRTTINWTKSDLKTRFKNVKRNLQITPTTPMIYRSVIQTAEIGQKNSDLTEIAKRGTCLRSRENRDWRRGIEFWLWLNNGLKRYQCLLFPIRRSVSWLLISRGVRFGNSIVILFINSICTLYLKK